MNDISSIIFCYYNTSTDIFKLERLIPICYDSNRNKNYEEL